MSSLKESEKDTPVPFSFDSQLLLNIQKGDKLAEEQLIFKYEKIIQKKANTYFLIGGEREDVIQEGLIGLYQAICNYDVKAKASFRSFAELCITRQIISSVKTATRQKHGPLNSYVSLYKPSQENSNQMLIETIGDASYMEPSLWIEQRDSINSIRYALMKTLTGLEWEVLNKYVDGYSYEEISQQIDRQEKAVDNAIQRIKRKVAAMIRQYKQDTVG
ncbi:MAG TPA: RNA polymerase sporulation sigma factor SigH [Pseudogracilibacillus sp.]|nr:RNA polymerase sporulation sigma factor SigH [Pseudogracilibacillus sp.]